MLSLLLGCLPQRDQVVVFAVGVFWDFENDRVESTAHPSDGPVLFRHIQTRVEIVRMRPYLLNLERMLRNGPLGSEAGFRDILLKTQSELSL